MADTNSTRPASHHAVYCELMEIFLAQQGCSYGMRVLLDGPIPEVRDHLTGLMVAIEHLAAEGERIAEDARDRRPILEDDPTPEPRS